MSNTHQAASTSAWRAPLLFLVLLALFALEGGTRNVLFSGSWNTSLAILNMGLVSAVTAMGINIMWGYGGLFNAGVVGFFAFGGLAPILISTSPVPGAWAAGGLPLLMSFVIAVLTLIAAVQAWQKMQQGRMLTVILVLIAGAMLFQHFFLPATRAIEANGSGNIGGLGLPILLAWPVGALMAALVAWGVGKVALGLRSDYLAIATLGIGEIIVAVLKNEDWLARGVKNVTGIPRPVAYEIDLQNNPDFVARAADWGLSAADASGIWVKLSFAALFMAVLAILIVLSQLAQNSPWGRMMRAIRDNETAAAAMGKNVTRRHLQVFVIGCAVIGLAGAMRVTLDGLHAPNAYNPLTYTFLIWVMVIVGGAGNNWGAVLGAILIWFLWIKAEGWGPQLISTLTGALPDGGVKDQLIAGAASMRYLAMGVILLLVLRFAPRGLVPER